MILVRNAESLDICPSPSSELVPLRVLVIKEIVVKLEKVGILGDGDGGGDSTDGREQEGSEPDQYPLLVGCGCNAMDPWKHPRNILSWGLLCIRGARMELPRRND